MRILLLFSFLMCLCSVPTLADDWTNNLLTERAEVDSICANDPTSPFASIGQAVLRPDAAFRVVLAADTLLLGHQSADPGLPQLEFTWKQEAGIIYVRSPQGGDFVLNTSKIGPIPMEMTSDDIIIAEHFQLKAYASTVSARVRAFKPMGYGQSHFHGLNWYEPDSSYVVTASVEAAARDTVTMPTSAGLTKFYIRHSTLRFNLNGQSCTLTLFAPASAPDAYGFLPFTDLTTGEESYGAGRYIDFELPEMDQTELVIDFNEAYNPLCAYVPHYNCPIPPAENDLPVKVEAGEMIYEKH